MVLGFSNPGLIYSDFMYLLFVVNLDISPFLRISSNQFLIIVISVLLYATLVIYYTPVPTFIL